jgi:hypothetical protein
MPNRTVLKEIGLATELPRKTRPEARTPELRSYLPLELRAWKKRTGGSVRFTHIGVALEANGVTLNFPNLAAAVAAVA